MTRKEIHKAFLALNEIGYNTRENFECCDSCAWSELEKREQSIVQHQQQKFDNFIKTGFYYP